ncbi:MAG: 50S ribosomal protein L25 [Candidatus Aminicenantes bacterium]|nr:50S ribosomal protein L25 [Candidatus Aminicenantes bacterium]
MSLVIKSEKRDLFGKNASRRFRKGGLVPAVLYGEGAESVPLVLAKKDIVMILKSETRENTIFKIAFDSEEKDVMIKALQINATSDELLHADLILIAMDKAIRVSVPIELFGEAVGVKTEGGFVDFMTREVEIECLPVDIPERISVDISGLHLHESLKVADLTAPAGVKLISDPGTVLVLVQVPHEEKVEAKPEEEAVAAEAAAAVPAEPEVIKKERKKEEAEEK